MKLKVLFGIGLVLILLLVGCNDDNNTSMEVEDIRELVHDYSVGNITNQVASISSHELMVREGDDQFVYDISEEDFFVSIAPYVNETHP